MATTYSKNTYKTLPKFYQGMLYCTVNFIEQHITDPVQKKNLYAKLPIHDTTVEDQISYFDSHVDMVKMEQQYKIMQKEHKAKEKPKPTKAKPTKPIKRTKQMEKKKEEDEPEIMYLYTMNGTRYWTPDDKLYNGPLYSSVKDQDGDPSPSKIQVGFLENGVGIVKS